MSNVIGLGLGVIGCGWAAGEVARAAADLPRLRIVAAADPDPGRVEAYARRSGARPAADIDDLLADPNVAAVYVGTPHYLLAPIAERALSAGKHVLAEKPLALSPAKALRLGVLSDERRLKLAVFFELRCSGPVRAARHLIAEGAIGRPRLVRIRTVIDKKPSYWGPPEARSWRASLAQAGGGVLLMNTIHQLDALRYITGLDYVRASGEIDTLTPAEVEDAVSATLRLSNGALVNVTAAAHSPGGDGQETIEIDGEIGRLDLPYAFSDDPLRLYLTAEGRWREIDSPHPDMHVAMIASFLDAVLEGRAAPADAYDAAQALAAVTAVYRSAAEGRAIDIELATAGADPVCGPESTQVCGHR